VAARHEPITLCSFRALWRPGHCGVRHTVKKVIAKGGPIMVPGSTGSMLLIGSGRSNVAGRHGKRHVAFAAE
jgi:hypothetical protein